MRARIQTAFLSLLLIVGVAIIWAPTVEAYEDRAPLPSIDLSQVDQGAIASLSIHFPMISEGDLSSHQVQVRAYQIAQMKEGYPAQPRMEAYANAVGWSEAAQKDQVSKTDWAGIASALAGYMQADSISADSSSKIDMNRTATFDALPVGVYLILTSNFDSENNSYTFAPSLITVPNVDENGDLQYNINAAAKGQADPNTDEPKKYKVTKHWNDSSARGQRPAEITVDIVRDGEPYSKVTLSAANGWVYEWADADGHQWAVSERTESLNKNYTVTNSRVGDTFVVTNTSNTPPAPPGDHLSRTGVFMQYWWLSPAAMVVGLAMLGIAKLRQRRVAKLEVSDD